jgi:hypothetical protein
MRAAFAFASMAQGLEIGTSDVDLLLIADIGFADAVDLLYSAQAVLGRE